MNVAAIDTLALARKLKEKARFTPEQAEGVAEAINEVMADELATKRDLGDLRRDLVELGGQLRSEIDRLRADTELLKRDLTIRLGGMLIASVGILAAIIRL